MTILCALFGHKVDWSATHFVKDRWRGPCKRCHVPLTRQPLNPSWEQVFQAH